MTYGKEVSEDHGRFVEWEVEDLCDGVSKGNPRRGQQAYRMGRSVVPHQSLDHNILQMYVD